MEEYFKEIAVRIAVGLELIAAVIIAYGAVEALVSLLIPRQQFVNRKMFHKRRQVFLRFGVWLLLGLQFELAADIVRSAISPAWSEIGQLAAIAVIRTVLNYFLERDIKEFEESVQPETPIQDSHLREPQRP